MDSQGFHVSYMPPAKTTRLRGHRNPSRAQAVRVAAAPDDGYFWKICLCLAMEILATYWRVLDNQFINYDDGVYIFNGHVDRGLTLEGLRWAFTDTSTGNWHPLTFISHMLDVSVFGLNPGGHHLENVLWHATNSALLFIALWQMTGGLWRSALVAALFALHPLRVESVAWASERKDVLSSFFYIATVWAYARYTQRPQSWRRYALIAVTLVLGLMSKALLVTAPFLLLLLDFWPLARKEKLSALIREKLPFVGLVALFSVVTFLAQKQAGATNQIENITLSERLANVVVAYVLYLGKIVWPHPLTVLYPYERHVSALAVGVCLLLLLSVTALVLRFGIARRYLITGWFWFLGTMVPMIGIVQVGWQAYADRYTYVPTIGIFIALVWLIADLTSPQWRPRVLAVTAAILAMWAITTWQQLSYWHDDLRLFEHAVASTSANPGAQFHLAGDLVDQGRYADAIPHLKETMRMLPNYYPPYYTLGLAEEKLGNIDSANQDFSRAIRLKPDYAEAYYARGTMLIEAGKEQAAEPDFHAALKYGLAAVNADFVPRAYDALGVIAAKRGDFPNAIANFEEAIRARPDTVSSQRNLASALVAQGRIADAISHLERAVPATGGDPSLTSMLKDLKARKQ